VLQMTRAKYCLILLTVLVLGVPKLSLAAKPNPMHPTFHLLDAQGNVIRQAGMEPDENKTCGQCHDTAFIAGHTIPAHQRQNITCLSCHYECDRAIDCGKITWTADAFEPDGLLKRQWLKISKPAAANCATCHGLATPPEGPVAIPHDYRTAAYPLGSQTSEHHLMTRTEGAIFSAQDVSEALLNLAGRQKLSYPWDVHALKVLQCTDCHYAPNDPQHLGAQTGTTALLRGEPRREKLSVYLQKPDHRLITSNCQTCHDPLKGHAFLPYPARHFDMVACQSCHIPRQFGPAEHMVDATLLDESGSPLVAYRGLEGEPTHLNTIYTQGSLPLLLPWRESGPSGTSVRLTPVNPVSRWYWASGDSQEPLPREVLAKALLVNGHYRPELVAALDGNHDGRLERSELKLDTKAKSHAVEQLLVAAGVKNPTIRADVSLHKISHGVAGKKQALSDCTACHAPNSRLKETIVLASFTPGGIPPVLKGKSPVPGRIDVKPGDQVVFKPEPGIEQTFHVFGSPARNWSDLLGLLMLIGVVLAVSAHASYRFVTRGQRLQHASPTRREYLFTAYERLWHWVMALSVLALIVTGLQIHFPGRIRILAPANAVSTHNFFAVVMMINAFLALFYHLASAAIRQFFPSREGLAEAVTLQTKYYLMDIFKGLPAPFPRSPERKLNALQQITYLFLLNVLFPFQIITGVLIWLVGTYPAFGAWIGGLVIIAPLHNLGSWMFISFLVAHVYLATTGHTVMAHVRGMVEGYEDVEVPDITGGERV
jgi:thiosulfate reductase cytochrome b subunit/mono/diheme cytochrome c family protein